MSTSPKSEETTQPTGNVVTLPLMEGDGQITWSRFLEQVGMSLQSLPFVDANGQPVTVVDGNGQPVSVVDGNGQPISVVDASGKPVSLVDGSGQSISVVESMSQPVNVVDSDGQQINFADATGQPVGVTDPNDIQAGKIELSDIPVSSIGITHQLSEPVYMKSILPSSFSEIHVVKASTEGSSSHETDMQETQSIVGNTHLDSKKSHIPLTDDTGFTLAMEGMITPESLQQKMIGFPTVLTGCQAKSSIKPQQNLIQLHIPSSSSGYEVINVMTDVGNRTLAETTIDKCNMNAESNDHIKESGEIASTDLMEGGQMSQNTCDLKKPLQLYTEQELNALQHDQSNIDLNYKGEEINNLKQIKLFHQDQIFSKVEAHISNTIMNVLNDVSVLEELQKEESLQWDKEYDSWTVAGTLTMIQTLKDRLWQIINGEERAVGTFKVDRDTQTDDTATQCHVSTMCDILVPAVSAYGRGIKQPARFNHYSNLGDMDAPNKNKSDTSSIHKGKRHKKKNLSQRAETLLTGSNTIQTRLASQTVPHQQVGGKDLVKDSHPITSVPTPKDDQDSACVNVEPSSMSYDQVNTEMTGQGSQDTESINMATSCLNVEIVSTANILQNVCNVDVNSQQHQCLPDVISNKNSDLSSSETKETHFSILRLQPEDKTLTQVNESSGKAVKHVKARRKTWQEYEALIPFKFFCKQCSFKSKRQSHYQKHLRLHENNKTLYECKQCDFKTIRCCTLKRHEIMHSSTICQCKECKYITNNPKLLVKHVKFRHCPQTKPAKPSSEKRVYSCLKCSYKTLMLSRYRNHLQSHVSPLDDGTTVQKTVNRYKCDECDYTTVRKEHYVRHKSNVHSEHRPYLCDLCGMSFKRTDALSSHKLSHIDKKLRNYKYKCKECSKEFKSRAHLTEHMSMHSTSRQFLCDICGASFKTRSCQQKHIKSIHHNPRAFKCNTCFKTFNTKYAAQRHSSRIHDPMPSMQQMISTEHVSQEQVNQLSQIASQMSSQAFQQLDSQDGQAQDLSVQDIITPSSIEEYEQSNLQNNESVTAIMYLSNLNI